MDKQTAEIAKINMETNIDASPARVWQALTTDISLWWPAEFYAGGEEGKRKYVLEAQPGGRMFEQWDGGGGVLWGTVYCVEPNVRLQVLGMLFPNWGGPAESYNTWELKPHNNGTKLSFSESTMGRVSDDGMADKDKGWRFLWRVLKAHVEQKPVPKWED